MLVHGFHGEQIAKRRAGRELLSILKFTRVESCVTWKPSFFIKTTRHTTLWWTHVLAWIITSRHDDCNFWSHKGDKDASGPLLRSSLRSLVLLIISHARFNTAPCLVCTLWESGPSTALNTQHLDCHSSNLQSYGIIINLFFDISNRSLTLSSFFSKSVLVIYIDCVFVNKTALLQLFKKINDLVRYFFLNFNLFMNVQCVSYVG